MRARTNYIIAAWTGPRRTDPALGTHYLDNHLRKLAEIAHNLSQITVVIPYHAGMTSTMKKKLIVHNKVKHTPVVYLFKENRGLSYGSWSHAYMQSRGSFDFYFFTEDDYAYVADNFDTTMISIFGSIYRCGYLCTLVKDSPGHVHAAISNGMSSQIVLEQIVKTYGKLPYGDDSPNQYSTSGQLDFSKAFLDTGFMISDTTRRYRAPYWEPLKKTVIEFAPDNTEYLIKPCQMF